MKALSFAWILFAACAAATPQDPRTDPSGDDGGGAENNDPDAASADDSSGGDTPSKDRDAASDFVPADHPPPPQLINLGGRVLAQPRIVPVTWDLDPNRSLVEKFVAQLGASAYWGAATKDYGVGPATMDSPVHIATMPDGTIDGATIPVWLAQMLDGTHPEWPAPTPNTVYALFYPVGVTVMVDGSPSCQGVFGYHDDVVLADGTDVAFAVIPRCTQDPLSGESGFGVTTATAAHELLEAATDPHPTSNPAFAAFDDDHAAWTLFPFAEVGDLCEWAPKPNYVPDDFPFNVQRSWSNSAALAGHDPCVVPAGGAYFNSVPVLDETVSITLDPQTHVTTKGVRIPVGSQKTIDVVLFSDAPADPWTVAAFDVGGFLGDTTGPTLSFTFDQTTGQNGSTLKLTLSADAPGPYGGSVFAITSTIGKRQSLWVGFVAN